METDTQRFNKLLEEYVLKVAETQIAEVDAALQTHLIKLVIQIGNQSVVTTEDRICTEK